MNSFLPQKLYQLRKNLHLRQEDVARQLHLGRQTYGCYENGVRTPPLETLIQLADFYQVPVDYLIREDGPEKLSDCMYPLSSTEKVMVSMFRSLSSRPQRLAFRFMDLLVSSEILFID